MDKNDDGSVTMTREELYDLVWSTPMRHLGPRFGLSDVGLAKFCKKHEIPRPPVCYRAKREHGKPVRRTPLPTLEDDAGPIMATNSQRETPRAGATGSPDGPVVDVPQQLVDPHRLVARTAKSIGAARPNEQGIVTTRAKQTLDAHVARQDRVETRMPTGFPSSQERQRLRARFRSACLGHWEKRSPAGSCGTAASGVSGTREVDRHSSHIV